MYGWYNFTFFVEYFTRNVCGIVGTMIMSYMLSKFIFFYDVFLSFSAPRSVTSIHGQSGRTNVRWKSFCSRCFPSPPESLCITVSFYVFFMRNTTNCWWLLCYSLSMRLAVSHYYLSTSGIEYSYNYVMWSLKSLTNMNCTLMTVFGKIGRSSTWSS